MILRYIIPFLSALILALILTPAVKKIAWRFGVLDRPVGGRHIHKKPIALLGGVAVFVSFVLVLILSWSLGWLNDGIILNSQILGIILGGLILIIGGVLDDKFDLKPWQSICFPIVATLIVVLMGVVVKYVTNPFVSGTGPYGRALFYFNWVNLEVISIAGVFSFLWILGMTYTTKLLDGLDGLASGVGFLGALILFIVSLFWDVPMSGTSILCLILAGSLLGFLYYNWHPAKIFLGEGGSTFIGLMLGVLSIISGGKLATALLIMGIPILDVMWNVLRRWFSGKKILSADRKHLHFRLLDIGLSHRQAVLILYLFTLIFGASSLFLQSQNKVVMLGVLLVFMIILASVLVWKSKKINL